MIVDAQARADQIAREWLAEQMWLADRRAQRAAERRSPPARRPLSPTAAELHEALLSVPADVWLPALTDLEIPRSRTIRCPFHGEGQERTPSCRIYERSYYCFGCGRGGDIFNFAAELWGVPTRSRDFPQLRERLADRLLGVTA